MWPSAFGGRGFALALLQRPEHQGEAFTAAQIFEKLLGLRIATKEIRESAERFDVDPIEVEETHLPIGKLSGLGLPIKEHPHCGMPGILLNALKSGPDRRFFTLQHLIKRSLAIQQ